MNMNIEPVFLTVCTPTYNRAQYLTRLFLSLKEQRFRNFEWIVIDDGSTDNTADVVHSFIKDADFRLLYFYQANAGKHIALNRALDVAAGQLFFIIDSDDYCVPDGLNLLSEEWFSISHRSDICGMTFLNRFPSGAIVGSEFPFDHHIAKLPAFYEKYQIRGDKCNAIRTDIFRAFKFPETQERFCPESLIWNRMAEKYNTLFVNKAVNVVEYLRDGLSANMIRIRANSPINTMLFYEEYFLGNRSLILKMKSMINYFRFSFHGKRLRVAILSHPLVAMTVFFPAIVAFMLDCFRMKKTRNEIKAFFMGSK